VKNSDSSKHSCNYTWLLNGLDDAFSEFFELEATPVEGQSLQQKEKAKKKVKKIEKPKDVGH